jgi:hypothetical protein
MGLVAVALVGLVGGGDGVERGAGLIPLVGADIDPREIHPVVQRGLGVGGDGLPGRDGLGVAACAHEGLGQAAPEVHAVGLGGQRAAEVGHGLPRLGHGHHDVVEAGGVDDVDVLDGVLDLRLGRLAGAEKKEEARGPEKGSGARPARGAGVRRESDGARPGGRCGA